MSDLRPLGARITHALKARGVEVIFGIPGVHNVEMYRGIEQSGLTHVLARHEQGAGFMADGYARATGRPGVAYVITGPGLTNVLTPLGQSLSDSVPVLVISTGLEGRDLGMGHARLHDMLDQAGAAATVTGWSLIAHEADVVWELIDRAFSDFAVKRPRPVHIQVPITLAGTAVPPGSGPGALPERPGPAPGTVARVAAMLREAKRPLMVLGGGSRGAFEAIRSLHRRCGALAIATSAGRGVVPDDDPLSLGGTLARPGAADWLGRADLVLALGTELSETDLWRDHPGHSCPMVRVDLDPAVLADRWRAEVPVQSDAGAFAEALNAALAGHEAKPGWSAPEVARARAAFRAEAAAERPGVAGLAEVLRASLPPDCTIVSDMTQFAYVALECWPMSRPGLWHHPYGFGTLGYALPAAIGAKVGLGARPVAAIAGDYGFQYTMAELSVAVELGLNLPLILWDNGKLGEIEAAMRRSQIAPAAVVARNPDFLALARAFGARAVEPRGAAGVAAALAAAFEAPVPTLIRLTPQTL